MPNSTTNPSPERLARLQAEQKSPNISLGIEIEFVLARCDYHSDGPETENNDLDLGQQLVCDLLSQPMQARCGTCGKAHVFILPVQRCQAYSHDYNKWTVTSDVTADLSNPEMILLGTDRRFYTWYPIEIRSRILHRDHPHPTRVSQSMDGHVHTINFADEITAVFDRLAQGFGPPGESRFTILMNGNCGLHVHVGNQQKGFPLQTIKNTLSTYVASERAIDAMHATSRIGGSTLPLESPSPTTYFTDALFAYNMPISASHSQGVSARRREAAGLGNGYEGRFCYPSCHFGNPAVKKAAYQYSAAAQLTLIHNAPDLDALKDLQRGNGHSSTIELQNIHIPPKPHNKMTLEFRQHAGTLQAIEVVSWIDVVVNILLHAHNTPAEEYADLCMTKFRSPTHDTIDLLKTLGCTDKTVEHYRHKLGMRRTGGCYADDLAASELAKLDDDHPCQLFLGLQRHLIELARDNNCPQTVRARISQKLLSGGYGQLSASYLQQLELANAADKELQDRLRIGYMNPM